MTDSQRDIYVDCITKQLEEVDLLSSIYCSPGEMHIFDPGVISDFNDFLQRPSANAATVLKAHLDYTITLNVVHGSLKDKLDIRIELPHLYPLLENAIVVVQCALLTKAKEVYLRNETEKFIATLDKTEPYVFQVVSWLQDKINDLIACDAHEFEQQSKQQEAVDDNLSERVDCERLWIYSHHIKSKKKRQEIIREARNLNLSGFCRPGKPGIICVEGLQANTQEFWRIIKALRWQKISICKSEITHGKLEKMRRFEGFKEQLFCEDAENEDDVMDMGLFLKYLEMHRSGYMKKELFSIE